MKINPIHTKVLNAVRNQGGADSAPPPIFLLFYSVNNQVFVYVRDFYCFLLMCECIVCQSVCARVCVCVCM